MTERDEQALRAALRQLDPGEPVETTEVRRRVAERRRNRRAVAALAVALVLAGGVVGLPRVLPGGGAQSASPAGAGAQAESAPSAEQQADTQESADARAGNAPPTSSPAPAGWRTEYYRDISFQVPRTWGYAVPPGASWCAGEGELRAEQRTPYVWLGVELAEAAISCPPLPERMLSEHVRALAPGPATDYVEGAVRTGRWWVVTRFAGSAVLVVTTQDRNRAERILDSAQVVPDGDGPCRPTSPITGPAGTRPDDVTDLALLPPVDWVVLCQYEPVTDPADAGRPRLRATVRLDRSASRALVTELASAPANEVGCPAADAGAPPDLAVLVRIWVDGEGYRAFVNPAGCTDGSPGMTGGVDDGTTVRVLTAAACRRLLTPPIALFAASGDVGTNCSG